ncbi:MAG: CPBP family intramembrane metalloprotease [Lachnospiraceae bacterium]|nr:CPBP family intramembrane metalloprotease [Lachnospiraceae bacterium]
MEILNCFTTAAAEEIVFRCGMLNFLLMGNDNVTKKKEVFVCIYSGLLFGIMHLPNIFIDSLDTVLWTILLGSFIGYVYGIIFLKTKNLPAVVILHAVWDFTAFCNGAMIREKYRFSGSYNFMHYQIPIILIMVIIMTMVLYKSKKEELT